MKRAVLIVTTADLIWVQGMNHARWESLPGVEPSEQLLADLRLLVEPYPDIDEWNNAASRVRALLPKEEA